MESSIDIPCTQCGNDDSLSMLTLSSEIPYFGEHTQVTILCDHCGWKHTDFIPSDGAKPGSWSIVLDSIDKISARVVRSSSCTIRIPHLDLEASPGSSSSGFVTNIEGVINRFEHVVGSIIRANPDSKEIVREANNILNRLTEAKTGTSNIALLLLDPKGRSQIIHEDAVATELTKSEATNLDTGPEFPVFDI